MASSSAVTTESVLPVLRAKRYKSYTFEDRLKVIKLSESGFSSLEIGKSLGIDSSLIRGWLRRYRKEGLDGLVPRPHRKTAHAGCLRLINSDMTAVRGYVHYVDNPILVRSMVDALLTFGIDSDKIFVGKDITDFSRSMASGDTVVVNSLFDLSSSTSRLLSILEELLQSGITIVSLTDNCQSIAPDATNPVAFLKLLGKYLSGDWMDIPTFRQVSGECEMSARV
ncbi:MAG: helix-turn-helix domain containing protein [Bacteroidaceae bacterium]|nr:helix-turn-helix domain containing protein [Bacteroidaceae bacterium]